VRRPTRKAKKRRNVRKVMDQFLRQFAKSYRRQGEKLHGIVKYRDELGPEWCLKVTTALDDVIEEFQRVRSALDVENDRHPVRRLPVPTRGGENENASCETGG
jgi:hypothetical protein